MQVTITLTDAQVSALTKLDLINEAESVIAQATKTAIKTKYKYMMDKAEESAAGAFDTVSKMGVSIGADRGAFIAMYMGEIREVLNAL